MKKIILAQILLFISVLSIFAGGSSRFRLEKNKDLLILAAGGGTIVTGAVLKTFSLKPQSTPPSWLTYPKFHYNKDFADASNYLVAAGFATLPFLMDNWNWNEAAVMGVMYVESLSLTWGVKESLKAVFTKYRPYTTYPDTPSDLMTSTDRYYSFPSGHASIAFTTAGFATAVFAASDATPLMKYIFGGVNFTVAAGIAALRVVSGEHYLVDVAAGAVLGTASGVLVPLLHRIKNENGVVSLHMGPGTVVLDFSY